MRIWSNRKLLTIETGEKCAKNLLKEKLTKICTKNCTKIFTNGLKSRVARGNSAVRFPRVSLFGNFDEMAKTRVLRTVEPFFFFLIIAFNHSKMQKFTLKCIFSIKIAPRFAPRFF